MSRVRDLGNLPSLEVDEEQPVLRDGGDSDSELDDLEPLLAEDRRVSQARVVPPSRSLAWAVVVAAQVAALFWAGRWKSERVAAAVVVVAVCLAHLAYTWSEKAARTPSFDVATSASLLANTVLLLWGGNDDAVQSAPFVCAVVTQMAGVGVFDLSPLFQRRVLATQALVFVLVVALVRPTDTQHTAEGVVCFVVLVGAMAFAATKPSATAPPPRSVLLHDMHKRVSERQMAHTKLFPEEASRKFTAFLSPVERAVLKLKRMRDSPGVSEQHKRAISSVMSTLYASEKGPSAALGMDAVTEAWMKQERILPRTPRDLPRKVVSGGSVASDNSLKPLVQEDLDDDFSEREQDPRSSRGTDRFSGPDSTARTLSTLSLGQAFDMDGGRYPEQLLDKDKLARVQQLLDGVDEWNFPVFELDELSEGHALYFMALAIFQRRGFIQQFDIPPRRLRNFLLVIESNYQPNPYHNSTHAADVLQTYHYFLLHSLKGEGFAEYALAACIAAIVHDYEHNGVNNDFLVKSKHSRAYVYNDQSCQENHHLAAAFACLRETPNNFLSQLSTDKQRFIRKTVIDCVLATDMARHNDVVSQFRLAHSGGIDLGKEEHIGLVMKLALKCADVSHTSKEDRLHDEWTKRITEEFCRQGDLEQELGLPLSPIMDRANQNLPKSQLGFFKFVVEPMFEAFNAWLQMEEAPFMLFLHHHHARYTRMLESSAEAR